MLRKFDYSAESELFCAQSISRYSRVTYKRFRSAADAIRYVIEDMPANAIRSATLEVSEIRFNAEEIRSLYDSPGYPLDRVVAS